MLEIHLCIYYLHKKGSDIRSGCWLKKITLFLFWNLNVSSWRCSKMGVWRIAKLLLTLKGNTVSWGNKATN
jgi:hypothetical protein